MRFSFEQVHSYSFLNCYSLQRFFLQSFLVRLPSRLADLETPRLTSPPSLFLQRTNPRFSRLVNITNLFFLVTSVAVPTLVQRYNPRKTVIGASFLLVVSGWIRYASTAPGLQSGEKAWGVLLGSQVLVGLSQPFTLCIGSESSSLREGKEKRSTGEEWTGCFPFRS